MDAEARQDARDATTRHALGMDLAQKVRSGQMTPQQAASKLGTTVADFMASFGGGLPEAVSAALRSGGQIVSGGTGGRGGVLTVRMPNGQTQTFDTQTGAQTTESGSASHQGEIPTTDRQGRAVWSDPKTGTQRPRTVGVAGEDPRSSQAWGPQAGGPPGGGPAGPAAAGGPPAGAAPAGGVSAAPAGPSAPMGSTGLSIGQVEDYQAMVVSMLQSLGFDSLAQDYKTSDLTTDSAKLGEIAGYARAKIDRGGLEQLMRNRPDLVAINPGLPYKLTAEQYKQQRGEVERAAAAYGTTSSGDMTAGTQSPWETEAFKEGMTPAEIEAGMASQFKRLGTAPSGAQDVQAFRTRPTQDTAQTAVKPPVQETEAGPAQTTLAGPQKNYVGARRK